MNRATPRWTGLPYELQKQIIGQLSTKDRLRCRLVCHSWNAVVLSIPMDVIKVTLNRHQYQRFAWFVQFRLVGIDTLYIDITQSMLDDFATRRWPVRKLILRCVKINALPVHLKGLEDVTIETQGSINAVFEQYPSLRRLKVVQWGSIGQAPTPIAPQTGPLTLAYEDLSIEVDDGTITGEYRFPRLEVLDLGDFYMASMVTRKLKQVCVKGSNDQLIQFSKRCEAVGARPQTVDLTRNTFRWHDDGFGSLIWLSQTRDLTLSQLSPGLVMSMIRATGGHLTALKLFSIPLEHGSFTAIAHECPALERLTVWDSITDVELDEVSASFSGLRLELDVRFNSITKAAINRALKRLQKTPRWEPQRRR